MGLVAVWGVGTASGPAGRLAGRAGVSHGLSGRFVRHGGHGSIAESEEITNMLLAKRFAAVWRGRVFGLNGKGKGALVWEGPGTLVVWWCMVVYGGV